MTNLNELQKLVVEANDVTNGAYENVIKHTQDEFWSMLEIQELEPSQVANMVHFGSYNPSHEFIGFDGYGNIETMTEQEYYNELLELKDELINELD